MNRGKSISSRLSFPNPTTVLGELVEKNSAPGQSYAISFLKKLENSVDNCHLVLPTVFSYGIFLVSSLYLYKWTFDQIKVSCSLVDLFV